MNCRNSIIIILLSLLSVSGLYGQDIDQDRMQRDINIMESVLEEFFKTSWGARGSNVKVVSGQLAFGNKNKISGTYLEDYGVIFSIPGGPPAFVVMSDEKDEVSTYHFQDGSDEEEVTEETITKRIKEFLGNYGSTINQLNAKERITVIYKNNRLGQSNTFRIFSSSGSEANKQKLPTISVTAKYSDLQAYRKRDIGENEFNNRLSVTTVTEKKDDNRDLKVMANILETTFEDAENDAFKIRGSVNHLYLDGVGALFETGASFGIGLFTRIENGLVNVGKRLSIVGERLSAINFDSLKTTPLKIDSIRTAAIKTDSIKTLFFNGNNRTKQGKLFFDDKTSAELEKERAEAYQIFLQQLKETLIDYGRTLKSVQSDEIVLVSVSISNSGDYLPERVDIQLKKSVLEAYDKGNMSREQAMEQITVREY